MSFILSLRLLSYREKPKEVDPTKETPPKPTAGIDGPLSDMMTGDMPSLAKFTTILPQSCASDAGILGFEKNAYSFGETGAAFKLVNVTKKEIARR